MGDMQLWPKNQILAEKELIRAVCATCDQVWGIHQDMAGFRLACDCGGWVEVPWPVSGNEQGSVAESKVTQHSLASRAEPPPEDLEGLVKLAPLPLGEVRMEKVSTSVPLAPGELLHASVESKARWTNRTILELVGILFAFWIPMLIVSWNWPADQWVQLMPLTSLVSSVLVVTLGYFASAYSFSGLRMPKHQAFAEAAIACAIASILAYLYVEGVHALYPDVESSRSPIVDTLGIPLSIVIMALCPGIFEELAFRGLLQGRISALMGSTQGILVTGVAFALAHGVTLAFPIHLGLGLYLCSLRARSGSLLPGMLFHALYNTAVILTID